MQVPSITILHYCIFDPFWFSKIMTNKNILLISDVNLLQPLTSTIWSEIRTYLNLQQPLTSTIWSEFRTYMNFWQHLNWKLKSNITKTIQSKLINFFNLKLKNIFLHQITSSNNLSKICRSISTKSYRTTSVETWLFHMSYFLERNIGRDNDPGWYRPRSCRGRHR